MDALFDWRFHDAPQDLRPSEGGGISESQTS
jgi:hypothetical protein